MCFLFLVSEGEMSRNGKIIRSLVNFIWLLVITIGEIFMLCNSETETELHIMFAILSVTRFLLMLTSATLLVIGVKRCIFRKKINKYIVLNIMICLFFSGVLYGVLEFAINNECLFVEEDFSTLVREK